MNENVKQRWAVRKYSAVKKIVTTLGISKEMSLKQRFHHKNYWTDWRTKEEGDGTQGVIT